MKKNIFLHSTLISFVLCNNLVKADEVKLNELTVTANKIEEKIINVPQTITVVDNIELDDKEIKNISELIKEIPNLSSRYLYFDSVNFRGINTSAFTNNNPVVLYIDGIPYSNKFGYNVSFANIERVEILRGPQSTLYGKDSIGGVINVITKEASNEFEGELNFEYGTNHYNEEKLNLSGPIIENRLFFGINGKYTSSEGWINNEYDNSNADENYSYNVNGNLLFNVNDSFSAKLSISQDKDNRDWIKGGIISDINLINNYSRKDFENANYDTATFMDIKSDSQALKFSYDFQNLNLNSVTTHKKVDIDGNFDPDWTNSSSYHDLSKFQYANDDNYTQELTLSNKNDNFKYVLGLYYENDTFENEKYGLQKPPRVEMNAVSRTKSYTYAAFGQITFPLINKLDLTLGGRFQKIKKEIDLNYYYSTIGSKSAPYYSLKDDNTWNTFIPKLALSYKINDNLSTYVNISKGYMPGGYNYFSYAGSGDNNLFDAQTSKNYELGIRGDFFDNTLFLSGSIFYMDIDDIHVYRFDSTSNMMYVSNGGKSHSQGLELELKYSITDNLNLESSLGLIEAKYDEYILSDSVKDNKVENTPSYTLNIGLSYYTPKGFYGRVDLQNQGEVYFDTANQIKQKAYTLTNAKVGYLLDDWDIYAYVKNISDESYLTTVKSDQGGYLATFGEGRFIGVGARYTF